VDLEFKGITAPALRAVFIRAPWVESVGVGVQVLASQAHAVAVQQNGLLATSFHPELTGDNRIHRYFIESVARPALERAAVK
jgi:5'-phosphate synthase pdxT subunit